LYALFGKDIILSSIPNRTEGKRKKNNHHTRCSPNFGAFLWGKYLSSFGRATNKEKYSRDTGDLLAQRAVEFTFCACFPSKRQNQALAS